jgi:hypothetical protein
MKPNGKPSFDPKIFLAKSDGRTIADHKEHQLVFSQGDLGGRHLLYLI